MKCLNLTDLDLEIEKQGLDHLARVDNIYVASRVDTQEKLQYLKSLGIKFAIDLKASEETSYDDRALFEEAGIEYHHFPVTDMGALDFEALQTFNDLLAKAGTEKQLVYCASGNRVGALLTLNASLVCGHPKQRAMEFGTKIGMKKAPTQDFVQSVLTNGGFK